LPPICLHLGIAEEAIERLHHPVVDGKRGSYYLGSTAPDIRFFIDAGREETHFLPLDSGEGESGIKKMFQAYPELMKDAGLNAATKSFVAGYLSHLVTDEAWIYQIYRPFFGKLSSAGGNPMANLLDRVLQFELDRSERLNSKSMSAIRTELNGSADDVTVSFINVSKLKRWSEFVFMATTRKPDWEHFRHFAEKYLIWMRQIAPEEQDTFFASFDERREQVLRMVPREQLQAFREQSIVNSVKAAKEYLG
jgi:hypothetical protein